MQVGNLKEKIQVSLRNNIVKIPVIGEYGYYSIMALLLKLKYYRVLIRLKKEYGKRKIKVGFIVSEIAKWKGQTLFDIMANSEDFDPLILIIPSSHELKKEGNRIDDIISEKVLYFKNSGMQVKNIWNIQKQKSFSASDIGASIIFYQQTWDIPPAPLVENVAGHALTFYFSYYITNSFIPALEVNMYLHYCIYRYILLNIEQVKYYQQYAKSINYAGKMIGLGHPIVDSFYLNRNYKASKNYVIYAPHFSFKYDRGAGNELPFYSSTFLEHGRLILEFAKSHPEQNWVFKPHPRLKTELVDNNVWTKEEVESYYHEWEKIGIACYDSHYIELFLESKALITDSNSFLTEYSCTGKPLIRLIPGNGETLPPVNPFFKKLYDSFYKVYQEKDLYEALNMIVLDGKDPLQKQRIENVKETHLAESYAAQNIIDYIRDLLTK